MKVEENTVVLRKKSYTSESGFIVDNFDPILFKYFGDSDPHFLILGWTVSVHLPYKAGTQLNKLYFPVLFSILIIVLLYGKNVFKD